MNIHTELVTYAAAELGDLLDQLVLVGGCATGFLVTDPDSVQFRSTKDIDVVTTVTKTSDYQNIERQLRNKGFTNVQEFFCRFQKGELILDLMPTGGEPVGGHVNPWYREGVDRSNVFELPSGASISVIHPALFVATKLVAFNSRGGGLFMDSHDMEDIITIVSGREELSEDISEVSQEAQNFICGEIETLVGEQSFIDSLPGLVRPDPVSQARVSIITERLIDISGI